MNNAQRTQREEGGNRGNRELQQSKFQQGNISKIPMRIEQCKLLHGAMIKDFVETAEYSPVEREYARNMILVSTSYMKTTDIKMLRLDV